MKMVFNSINLHTSKQYFSFDKSFAFQIFAAKNMYYACANFKSVALGTFWEQINAAQQDSDMKY